MTITVAPACDTDSIEVETKEEAEQRKATHVEFCDECDPDDVWIEADEKVPTVVDGGEVDRDEVIPEPSQLTSDPLEVISKNAEQFTDVIQGTVTINRQGYAVLAEQFNISVESEPVTLPSETGFEYAEFRAVATTEDGETYTGFGSAHVERDTGDSPYLLGELAETRAMKRATAWATGVGMTAVSELDGSGER